jgi:hypothetical protein
LTLIHQIAEQAPAEGKRALNVLHGRFSFQDITL